MTFVFGFSAALCETARIGCGAHAMTDKGGSSAVRMQLGNFLRGCDHEWTQRGVYRVLRRQLLHRACYDSNNMRMRCGVLLPDRIYKRDLRPVPGWSVRVPAWPLLAALFW